MKDNDMLKALRLAHRKTGEALDELETRGAERVSWLADNAANALGRAL